MYVCKLISVGVFFYLAVGVPLFTNFILFLSTASWMVATCADKSRKIWILLMSKKKKFFLIYCEVVYDNSSLNKYLKLGTI